MNYAQKYDLFFPFFIKVVVNKSKAYSFLIIGMMHLQKNITFFGYFMKEKSRDRQKNSSIRKFENSESEFELTSFNCTC